MYTALASCVHGRGAERVQGQPTCIYTMDTACANGPAFRPSSQRRIKSFKKTCGTTGFCGEPSVLPPPPSKPLHQRATVNGRSNRETEFVVCSYDSPHRPPFEPSSPMHARSIEIRLKHAIEFNSRVPRLFTLIIMIKPGFCRSMNSVSQSVQSVSPSILRMVPHSSRLDARFNLSMQHAANTELKFSLLPQRWDLYLIDTSQTPRQSEMNLTMHNTLRRSFVRHFRSTFYSPSLSYNDKLLRMIVPPLFATPQKRSGSPSPLPPKESLPPLPLRVSWETRPGCGGASTP